MHTNIKATLGALITTCLMLALLLSPYGLLLGHFLLIWPVVGTVDDLGLLDLGESAHGFFLPNAAGSCFAAALIWLIAFLFIHRYLRRKVAR